jgi:hypothetical protein
MMMTNKRLYATGAALLLTLALGACGGSDNDDHNNGGTPVASAGESDSFFAQVRALIANSPDDTEPVAIESFVATTPENIEPAAL